MKLLAIDYGSKTIGLAISNNAGTIAFPHATLARTSGVIKNLKKIIADQGIQEIIVGIPSYKTDTPFYRDLQKFISALKAACDVPVRTQDELVTSREAKNRSGGRDDRHDLAAQIILETYLQTKNPS